MNEYGGQSVERPGEGNRPVEGSGTGGSGEDRPDPTEERTQRIMPHGAATRPFATSGPVSEPFGTSGPVSEPFGTSDPQAGRSGPATEPVRGAGPQTRPMGTGDEGRAVPEGTPSGTGAAAAPAVPAPAWAPAAPTGRRGLRIRTMVFGLILLAISVSCLVTLLSTVRLDAAAVSVAVLIGAGVLLVGGGLAAAVREARGGPGS